MYMYVVRYFVHMYINMYINIYINMYITTEHRPINTNKVHGISYRVANFGEVPMPTHTLAAHFASKEVVLVFF